MELMDIQEKVKIFTNTLGLETSLEIRMLDLLSELGELSKEVLKGNRYGDKEFVKPTDWDEEIGDVFFSLLCVANMSGVNLDRSLENVLKKYERRFLRKGSIGSDR